MKAIQIRVAFILPEKCFKITTFAACKLHPKIHHQLCCQFRASAFTIQEIISSAT